MITKLRQIWNDHKAMQIFRKHHGDLKLVYFVGAGNGYECYIFQHNWCRIDPDPSKAILRAYTAWEARRKGMV